MDAVNVVKEVMSGEKVEWHIRHAILQIRSRFALNNWKMLRSGILDTYICVSSSRSHHFYFFHPTNEARNLVTQKKKKKKQLEIDISNQY